MKVIFFNRFFHPDTSATSQIVSDLAFDLAASGFEVHAITSRSAESQSAAETVRGVRIHRVAGASTTPHNLFERALAYAAYYRAARRIARALVAPGDIAIVKTDPPMLSAALGPIVKRRGGLLVAWLQDVFPEIAREYGVPGMRGMAGGVVLRMRNRSLALADAVVTIGDAMARRVAPLLRPGTPLHVIHNWADGVAIQPLRREANALRAKWRLERAFVVGYSGNLGRVHEFDTILGAAAALRDDPSIRFVIVGRGPRLAQVQASAARQGLDNVVFQGHQDRDALGEALGVADVHLSVLQPRFEGLVHPSKLYGIMAAGRPTIFVGDAAGETASILAATSSGLTVPSGDPAALAAAIRRLRDEPALLADMGRAARTAFDDRYAMPLAFGKWREVLRDVTAAGAAASRRSE